MYKEIQDISAEQMAKFRSLVSNKPAEASDPLAPNYRPVQPVNGRPVRLYSPSAAAASTNAPSTQAPTSAPSSGNNNNNNNNNGNNQGSTSGGATVVEVEDSETKGIAIAVLVLLAVLLLVLAVIFVTIRLQPRQSGKYDFPMSNGLSSNSHV